jgi:hypothetical protein
MSRITTLEHLRRINPPRWRQPTDAVITSVHSGFVTVRTMGSNRIVNNVRVPANIPWNILRPGKSCVIGFHQGFPCLLAVFSSPIDYEKASASQDESVLPPPWIDVDATASDYMVEWGLPTSYQSRVAGYILYGADDENGTNAVVAYTGTKTEERVPFTFGKTWFAVRALDRLGLQASMSRWATAERPQTPLPPNEGELPSGNLVAFDANLGCLNRTAQNSWETRNNGASSTALQGGYDPHWKTVQGSTDIERAILWRVETGHIYRSTDCGRSWVEMTNISDPTNAWGDDPYPTLEKCEIFLRADNIFRSGEHYFLVRWKNASGQWRGWILKCTGNGEEWMWQPLGGASYQKIGQYYYATSISDMNWDYPATWWDWNPPCPEEDHYGWSDLDKIVDGNDNTYGAFWRTRAFASTRGVGWRVHFGASFKRVNGYIEVQVKYMLDGASAGYWASEPRMWADNDPYGRVYGADWYSQSNQPDTWYVSNVSLTRYDISEWIGMDIRGHRGHTRARIAYIRIHETYFNAPAGSYGDSYPIWMDVDTAAGDVLYVTMWSSDNKLYLEKRSTSDLSLLARTDLGSATISEVLGKSYIAFPRVQEYVPNYIYVYGRMNAPAGLSGVQHIIRSTDGSTFSSIISDWGNHYCGALIVSGSTIMAVRNTGTVPLFYKGNQQVTLPLVADVPPDAITGKGSIAIGSGSRVIESPDGISWSDQNYPSGGDIRSLVYL